MHLKISSAQWRPSGPGRDELRRYASPAVNEKIINSHIDDIML